MFCGAVWIENSGTCYWLSENQVNFSEAGQSCLAMDSSMLSDETDVKFIIVEFEQNLQYWLNATYNGSGEYKVRKYLLKNIETRVNKKQ